MDGKEASMSFTYGVSCGTAETKSTTHSCTGACARLHLSGETRAFEKRLRRLAQTLPVADFVWLRAQYEAAFDRILFDGLE
jgi:hypothetical protein